MSKSEILLKSVEKFYENVGHSKILMEILNKKSVSLRNIEWFITKYARKNNLSYTTKDGKFFTVHMAYKSSLDGYSKKLFDPFCRSEKFLFKVPGTGDQVITTLAQLNFIKWCIRNNVIDFLSDNKTLLDHKM